MSICVLISGNGSNLQQLINNFTQINLVVSNKKSAYGLTRAAEANIPSVVFPLKPYKDAGKSRIEYDKDLAKLIKEKSNPKIIVLAGFMHILSKEFLQEFDRETTVINLHPALPKAFDGARAIERAFESWVKKEIQYTGVMVHKVIPEVDRGEVIIFQKVEFKTNDTLEDIEARIHAVEHELIVKGCRIIVNELTLPDPLEVFKKYAEIPSYSNGDVQSTLQNGLLINIEKTTRDFDREIKRRYGNSIMYNKGVLGTSFPIDVGEVNASKFSPSGKFLCVLRTVEKDGKKKRFVEILNSKSITLKLEINEKKHLDFYADGTCGGISWSSDEKSIVYTAESAKPIKELCTDFALTEDFGEGYSKKRLPVIVIIQLTPKNPKEEDDSRINTIELDFPVGQPSFTQDSKIIFMGVLKTPLIYGMKYCHNRQTAIYSMDVDGKNLEKISNGFSNARSPRIYKSKVYFLSNAEGGPHSSTSKLVSFDLDKRICEILVNIPTGLKGGEFPGFYLDNLPLDSFIGDFLFTCTSWGIRQVLVSVDLTNGKVVDQTGNIDYSWNLLSVGSDCILASRSNLASMNSLVLGEFKTGKVEWKVIEELDIPNEIKTDLAEIQYEIRNFSKFVQCILVKPKSKNNSAGFPLIVFPHGGPHSNFSIDFSIAVAIFCKMGFAVLMVNYTGSTGYGEESINALLGNIGALDISDVNSAAVAVSSEPDINADKVCLFGGSHGGFISAFLLGKYPNFYKCGVLRNPVINVGIMTGNTDIPDWCYIESGNSYELKYPQILSPKLYENMYEKSPASVASFVKSPVLIMLGQGDRRVPPSEGLRWGQYLASRGVDCTIMSYESVGHPLDSISAEKNGLGSYTRFLSKHMLS